MVLTPVAQRCNHFRAEKSKNNALQNTQTVILQTLPRSSPNLQMSLLGGAHQGSGALFVAGVDPSVVLQEQVYHVQVSKMGSLNQSGAAVVVGNVHLV